MTREEQIAERAKKSWDAPTFTQGAEWADKNPSDETIMRVLNCIGYEERSWIDTVRENWDKVGKEK